MKPMSEHKVNISIEEGVKELVIRTGNAAEPVQSIPVRIDGNIFAVLDYITRRKDVMNAIIHSCHIVMNEESGTIDLIVNEDSTIYDAVKGKLMPHQDLEKWGINNGKTTYTSLDLAMKVKMNRYMFPSAEEAMKLVATFQNLKAEISKKVELSDNQRGNRTIGMSQVINSMSIPEGFTIQCPVFKGLDPVNIQVEIVINPDTLEISLVSPQLIDLTASIKKDLFKDIENEVRLYTPDIVIIKA